jgi:hypothetical protein
MARNLCPKLEIIEAVMAIFLLINDGIGNMETISRLSLNAMVGEVGIIAEVNFSRRIDPVGVILRDI